MDLRPSPYSDSRSFSIVEMETISFSKLVKRDGNERVRLLTAAEKDGFFYLDLSGPESQGLWETYKKCLAAVQGWFDNSVVEKGRFAYESDIHGYKYIGSQAGSAENSRDGFETLRVSLNSRASTATVQPLPAVIVDNEPLITSFINTAQVHVHVLLSAFSDAHGLNGAARYETFHDASAPSNSAVSFHRYPRCDTISSANVGHNKHTDGGTLTLLFTSQWGLQVQSSADNDEWKWVRPRLGIAICNIGDALRFMSKMSLRSVVHRVVPTADQKTGHRYSVGWFCRPSHNTMFQDSEGRMIASEEWFAQKLNIMRQDHSEQTQNAVLTGGMEKVAS